MAMSLVFGERSLSKVAALFSEKQGAQAAAEQVIHDVGIRSDQVKVVHPGDTALGPKLEPESQGIYHTIIRAHAALGLAGLVAGLLMGGVLLLADLPLAAASPYLTVVLTTAFGGVVGLMVGGLVAIRPDHDKMIVKVEEGVHSGRSAVIVHADDHEQERRAQEVLQHSGGDVVKTL